MCGLRQTITTDTLCSCLQRRHHHQGLAACGSRPQDVAEDIAQEVVFSRRPTAQPPESHPKQWLAIHGEADEAVWAGLDCWKVIHLAHELECVFWFVGECRLRMEVQDHMRLGFTSSMEYMENPCWSRTPWYRVLASRSSADRFFQSWSCWLAKKSPPKSVSLVARPTQQRVQRPRTMISRRNPIPLTKHVFQVVFRVKNQVVVVDGNDPVVFRHGLPQPGIDQAPDMQLPFHRVFHLADVRPKLEQFGVARKQVSHIHHQRTECLTRDVATSSGCLIREWACA